MYFHGALNIVYCGSVTWPILSPMTATTIMATLIAATSKMLIIMHTGDDEVI